MCPPSPTAEVECTRPPAAWLVAPVRWAPRRDVPGRGCSRVLGAPSRGCSVSVPYGLSGRRHRGTIPRRRRTTGAASRVGHRAWSMLRMAMDKTKIDLRPISVLPRPADRFPPDGRTATCLRHSAIDPIGSPGKDLRREPTWWVGNRQERGSGHCWWGERTREPSLTSVLARGFGEGLERGGRTSSRLHSSGGGRRGPGSNPPRGPRSGLRPSFGRLPAPRPRRHSCAVPKPNRCCLPRM
jgi:hypothetical protein